MSIWGGSTSRDLLNVSSKNTHRIDLNYSARWVLLHAWQTPMYQRPQFNTLKQRIRAPRRVDEEPSAYHFVPADTIPSSDTSWIPQRWNNARLQHKRSHQDDFVLVIDEIQKISHWSELIKREP